MRQRDHDAANAASTTERLIAEALYHRRPTYMAVPSDVANTTALGAGLFVCTAQSM